MGEFWAPGAEIWLFKKKNMDRSIDLAVWHIYYIWPNHPIHVKITLSSYFTDTPIDGYFPRQLINCTLLLPNVYSPISMSIVPKHIFAILAIHPWHPSLSSCCPLAHKEEPSYNVIAMYNIYTIIHCICIIYQTFHFRQIQIKF